MKVFSNFQKSGMGEKENAEDDGEDEADEKEYIFSSNFLTFMEGTCAFITSTAAVQISYF